MQIKYFRLSIVRNEVVRCYKEKSPIFKSFLYCAANYRFILCVRLCNSTCGALFLVIIAVSSFQGS